MIKNNELIENINKIHTTKLGIGRIKQNLGFETDDVVDWCKQQIKQAGEIIRSGKNWYVYTGDSVITVNAYSYTIITAHRITVKEIKTDGFTGTDFDDAYEAILSMIHKLEKVQNKIKPGTPQWTTLIRRLNALRLAISLINRELRKNHNNMAELT